MKLIPNKIKIPTQFELGGLTISVVYEKNLTDKSGCVAQARMKVNEIALQENVTGVKIPVECVEESLFHELTHCVLQMMSEMELNNNEKFVSVFSQYLHQAFKTMEYKDEK